MIIPYTGSWFFSIPGPGFRIRIQQQQNRGGEKISRLTFLLAINLKNLKIRLFFNRNRKKFSNNVGGRQWHFPENCRRSWSEYLSPSAESAASRFPAGNKNFYFKGDSNSLDLIRIQQNTLNPDSLNPDPDPDTLTIGMSTIQFDALDIFFDFFSQML